MKGWIWPRDKPSGGTGRNRRWELLKDIFQGKGSDIFIGRLDSLERQPTKAHWSCWSDLYPNPDDRADIAMPWANRGEQRYDFRTRRYRRVHPGMWSNIEWQGLNDDGNPHLRAYWDADGHRHDLGGPRLQFRV